MRRTMTAAVAALAFVAAPLAAMSPPAAAETAAVTINTGGIAFGYSDGYWDRDHHWHKWRNQNEARDWREHNAAHYYDRRHDRDKDEGWRDSDHWWDHH